MAKTQVVICPYCGETQAADERCRVCGGFFEPLSRQATHNEMGPWYVRDPERPFRPGCSYETLVRMIEREQVTKYSIIRGPTTKQLWTVARRVPGVAHLLGYCHQCDAEVQAGDVGCPSCGAPFGAYLDRNHLGLPEIRPLPGEPGHGEGEAEAPVAAGEGEAPGGAAPIGLSSFATDEELVGSPRGGGGAVESRVEEPRDGGTGAAAVEADAAPDSPAVRSMQRRIAHQQRTIRSLVVVVLVVAVAAAVVIMVMVPAVRRQAEGQAAPAATEVKPEAVGDETADEAAGAGDLSQPAQAPDVEEDEVAPEEAPTAAERSAMEAFAAEYERALALAESAADTGRPTEERVGDYEQALVILRGIAAEVPEAQHPEGLARRINAIEDAVERLRLEEYFR